MLKTLGSVDSRQQYLNRSYFTDIVKEILKARPDFAREKDFDGCTPLHLACSKGHLEVTSELLRLDPDLTSLQDKDGLTPLHWAIIKGHLNIIDKILAIGLHLAQTTTKHGETVLHLGVKNNRYEAVQYLMEKLNFTQLLNTPDKNGNTILHLAAAGKLTTVRSLTSSVLFIARKVVSIFILY